MIILGDIATPTKASSKVLENTINDNLNIFGGKNIIVNLEGLICDKNHTYESTPILYNHPSIIDAFNRTNLKVVCLANNHTQDLPSSYEQTLHYLHHRKIGIAGAGHSFLEARQPTVIDDKEQKIILFNACWDFLLYHQKNPTAGIYIAEIDEKRLKIAIAEARNEFPCARICVYLHWNFDLEVLPFPSHRTFARDLIDNGADWIIGTHSHCVQGGEKYKDGYIIYGLGNFFVPDSTFANGKLSFPDFTRIQMAFEFDVTEGKAICHWFQYINDEKEYKIVHLESSYFEDCRMLKKYSPFMNMEHKVYVRYFRKHRRKKFFIPIYKQHQNAVRNSLYTWYLKRRGRIARYLAEQRYIKWQN